MKFRSLSVACAVVLAAISGQAATTVCRTESELQEAVSAVGTSGEICVVEGTYEITATLVVPKNAVVIRGVKDDGETPADRTKVVLNGCGDKRVLTCVQTGFVLRDLTVSNGYHTATSADANCGGGVYAANASLFSNCVFTCNRLGGTGNGGGGLGLMASGNTVIRDCLFENNSSDATGGAFHTQQASLGPRIYDTVFRNNASKGNGGAISTRNSGLINGLYGCTFEGNEASGNCGAVSAASLTTVSNCVFRLNVAKGSGGALAIDRNAGQCCVYSTQFLTNSASGTGGAITTATAGTGRNDYSFYDCTFDGNSATGYGGAMYMGQGYYPNPGDKIPYNATIRYATNTVFRGNRSSNSGGALYGSVQRLVDCKFIGNEQHGANATCGGAIYYISSPDKIEYVECPPLFERTDFIDNRCSGARESNNTGGALTNQGDGGGAVYANSSSAQLTFKGCKFLRNSTTNCTCTAWNHYSHGGCIFSRGYIAAEDCWFEGNAGYSFGGTIYAAGVTGGLRRCTFAGNYMRHPAGFGNLPGIARGTVYIDNYGSAGKTNVIEDCVFTNNVVCGQMGGGLQVRAGTLELTGCTFADNLNAKDVDEGVQGAAVYVEAAVTARIDRCAFVGNRTEHYNNTNGGGLYLAGTGYVRNCLFRDNVVTNEAKAVKTCGFGGGAYVSKTAEFSNCTFVNNLARYLGGGLYLGAAGGVTNCVFSGNRQTYSSAEGTADDLGAAAGTTVMNSFASVTLAKFLEDGVNGCIVKSENPFRSDDHCDLALRGGCGRGAGLVLDWMTAESLDLGGKPRLADSEVDFGCYQLWFKPGFMLLVR